MPARVKTSDNMSKHLTKAQKTARSDAEGETLPEREANLIMPPSVKKYPAAVRLWKSVLERMDGLAILDDLDAEMLGLYCTMIARRDALDGVCRDLLNQAQDKNLDAGDRLKLTDSLDSLLAKLQTHEKTALSYADKLGLTPTGRATLARKRSAAMEASLDDDLFGD